MPTDETITRFGDRLIDLADLAITSNGGRKIDNGPAVRLSDPTPVAPDRRAAARCDGKPAGPANKACRRYPIRSSQSIRRCHDSGTGGLPGHLPGSGRTVASGKSPAMVTGRGQPQKAAANSEILLRISHPGRRIDCEQRPQRSACRRIDRSRSPGFTTVNSLIQCPARKPTGATRWIKNRYRPASTRPKAISTGSCCPSG